MTVVPLRKEPEDPHLTGEAKCLACGHGWKAIAPVGTVVLTCPKCNTNKGVFENFCSPDVGKLLWHCNCGSRLFYCTTEAVHCAVCATVQVFP